MPHWTQRIIAAIVTGDARRYLERIHGLKGEAARATARRQTGRRAPPPSPPPPASKSTVRRGRSPSERPPPPLALDRGRA